MTPEEKAKELIEVFRMKIGRSDFHVTNLAKACALICVDEILNSEPMFPYEGGGYHELWTDRQEESTNFWQQVKQFINNPERE